MPRRHGALVTADRLTEAINRWPDRFTLEETAAAQTLAHRLQLIAAHDRRDTDSGWACSCGSVVSLAGSSKELLDQLFDQHAAGEPPPDGDPT